MDLNQIVKYLTMTLLNININRNMSYLVGASVNSSNADISNVEIANTFLECTNGSKTSEMLNLDLENVTIGNDMISLNECDFKMDLIN